MPRQQLAQCGSDDKLAGRLGKKPKKTQIGVDNYNKLWYNTIIQNNGNRIRYT